MTQHLNNVVRHIMPMIDCGGIYHDKLYTLPQNNNNLFFFNISETVFGDIGINLIHTALVNNVKNIQ